MIFFYQILLRLFSWFLPVVSLFNAKAKLFFIGRKSIFLRLRSAIAGSDNIIWFHCASLGEFEQVRPLIEKIKASGIQPVAPKILITFFSPSGYELRKDYKGADFVFYLPLDTRTNAKRFIEIVNPKKVFFVKYDFWYNYLDVLRRKNIPVYLVSANFRSEQFTGLYGWYLKKVLRFFTVIFVQNAESKELLARKNILHVEVSGDLRFDKVAQTAATPKKITLLEYFKGNQPLLVGGSTWEEDEKILAALDRKDARLVIAPHEIHETHIEQLLLKFPDALVYSKVSKEPVSAALPRLQAATVLVIDTMGMLASAYQYADVAYIGGGFGSGIHNILEATAFGVPTIFGMNHHKFPEAKELIDAGAAFLITDAEELKNILTNLLFDKNKLKNIYELNKSFVQSRVGATKKIMESISGN